MGEGVRTLILALEIKPKTANNVTLSSRLIKQRKIHVQRKLSSKLLLVKCQLLSFVLV
jgi:hypothetical protein